MASRGSRSISKKKKKKKVTPSQLADAYYDTRRPSAYGSISALQQATGADRNTVKNWLLGEKTYVSHRLARKKFDKDTIIVQGLNDQVSSDLADVSAFASENQQTRFLLVCVDSLSKFAMVLPLKDKKASTVGEALRRMYSRSPRKPRCLRSDRGKEYLGESCQRVLKELGIRHFTTYSKTKAAIAERYIRSLKSKIYKHFTATGRHRYIDVLQDLVKGYNDSVHSSTGMAPSQVTVYNSHKVWNKLYGHLVKAKHQEPSLKIGDKVLISKELNPFHKQYTGDWSTEIFQVADVRKSRGAKPRYLLVDAAGEAVLGAFKRTELQPLALTERVLHKVMRSRRDAMNRVPVQWRGYRHLTEWLTDV